MLWLAPWGAYAYPGRGRLLRAICGGSLTVHSINHWQSGRSPLPVWAALTLADAISVRAVAGLEIARQLAAYAEQKRAADELRGANLRKSRAAGVAPAGLGARANNPAPIDNRTIDNPE